MTPSALARLPPFHVIVPAHPYHDALSYFRSPFRFMGVLGEMLWEIFGGELRLYSTLLSKFSPATRSGISSSSASLFSFDMFW
jgi:hypothetical protein